jgi:hypothetical protein
MFKKSRVLREQKMLRILQESETSGLMASQRATSPGFNTLWHPRKSLSVRQQMSFRRHGRQLARETMITVFFTAKKLIVLDVLPRGSTFNQLYFINYIFPDLETANLNFRRQET